MSAVAADIGGVRSTHVNHLTPRVLDIDELYARMQARGVTMIDDIQGPPAWEGPDVLLRQTSFRALAEPRAFRAARRLGDPRRPAGPLRRGGGPRAWRSPARAGRSTTRRWPRWRPSGCRPRAERQAAAVEVWRRSFPATEAGLFDAGLAFAEHRVVDGQHLRVPIVYEDFLPQSAAGIFASNLSADATTDAGAAGVALDEDWLAGAMGRDVLDPFELYAAQAERSRARLR